MSNTVDIGVGSSTSVVRASALAELASEGAATVSAVARWLRSETSEQRAAIAALREERKQALAKPLVHAELRSTTAGLRAVEPLAVIASHALPTTSVSLETSELYTGDVESLVSSAEELGYSAKERLSPGQSLLVFLEDDAGSRLAIEKLHTGRTRIYGRQGRRRVQKLVQRNTKNRVVAHLRSRGMKVQTGCGKSGEVQIQAEEERSQCDGAAVVKAEVRPNGTARVDIDGIAGRRCVEIAKEIADAIDGKIGAERQKEGARVCAAEPVKVEKITL